MSSDEEDDVVLYYLYRRLRRRSERRQWVHLYIERNFHRRLFVAAQELQMNDSKFLAFYRMSKESYAVLLELVCPAIHYTNTNMRECVSAEERILITLRYLATGDTFVSLGLYFARGETTVGKLIAETTQIIWNKLKDIYMPLPSRNQWKNMAQRFQSLWNLPNCIGAIDGKHVRIEKVPNTGSTNYNYKSYHSVVLLGCCDADGLFTMIETGYAGRNSDGGIFRASAMKYWLTHSQLDIPEPSQLPLDDNEGCLFPYYFVGDEAFPLSCYLLRPYSKRVLDNIKRVFNYRLSRGRKAIECTFGMVTEKFGVLSTAIRCRNEETVNSIVKAVCVLHNFVRRREGLPYKPQQLEENYIPPPSLAENAPSVQSRIDSTSTANAVREYLAKYFVTPMASLPWQWQNCV